MRSQAHYRVVRSRIAVEFGKSESSLTYGRGEIET